MTKPLRILHIVQGLNRGGIETMLMNLYRNINRDSIQFDFVVSCIEKSDYEDEVLSMGGRIFRMSPISIYTPYKYLRDLNTFFIKHSNYEIIHAHMNAVSTLPLFIAKIRHVPVRICHSHNTNAYGIKGFLKWILKYPLRYLANHYFACSNDAAKYLYGRNSTKRYSIQILNNSIETDIYLYNPYIRSRYREQYNINNKLVIGHVGRFVSQKNHMFILDIFKLVSERNPNTILMLVGDGKLREKIEKKVSVLGLQGSVIMPGIVTNVHDFLQAMDIFLFPSFSEGLGMSLIEAQCSGLKCFASDTIPKESAVSDLIQFISLSQKADFWAEKILKTSNIYERNNMLSKIQFAGYDVKTTAKWLGNFYKEQDELNTPNSNS